jgi:hypothetical protein
MPAQGLEEGSVIRLPGVSHVSGPAGGAPGLRDLPLPADRLDDLLFLMNELVTNSFFHVLERSTVNIEVRVLDEAVRVEVRAGAETAPAHEGGGAATAPGWALAWLNESADRWGSEGGAQCVWFEIDRPSTD